MFTCALAPDQRTIALSGTLTLEHIHDIHAHLLQILPQVAQPRLDLSGMQAVDVSFIQLLHALLRTENTTVRVLSPIPRHLIEYAAAVGDDSLIKAMQNRLEDTP